MITIAVIKESDFIHYGIRTFPSSKEAFDHVFVDLSCEKKFKKILYVSMYTGENNNGLEIMKLKCWCQKNNYGLCFYGSLNQLPLLSMFADQMFLTTYHKSLDQIYQDRCSANIWPEDGFLPYYIRRRFDSLGGGSRDAGAWQNSEIKLPIILEVATAEISDEEMVETFKHLTIYVTEEALSLYHSLKTETVIKNDRLITEFKDWGKSTTSLYGLLKKSVTGWDIDLAPEDLRYVLWKRTGLNYMGVTILSGLLSNCVYACDGGSSNLFSLLPLKLAMLNSNYYIPEQVAKLSFARFCDVGRTLPLLNQKQMVVNFSKYEKEFKNLLQYSYPYKLLTQKMYRTVLTPYEEERFRCEKVTI